MTPFPEEALLTRTFEAWRKEFRAILETHRQDIQHRLEKIEREIEKKSDKDTVDVLIRSLTDDVKRHGRALEQLAVEVGSKVDKETLWKFVGVCLSVLSVISSVLGYMILR